MLNLRSTSLAVGLCLCAGGVASAQLIAMPPHASIFNGNTRGYWFTAPEDFRIVGLQVLQEPGGMNGFQNWAVVRFNNNQPPPQFSATTNEFVQLGFGFDEPSGAFGQTSIEIFGGDVIGIYGNTTATPSATTGRNSYTATLNQVNVPIMGSPVDLFRSGMQFHLGSATTPNGMQNIFRQDNSTAITRVEVMYEPLVSGCYANCDGSTAIPILTVDDFTCFINEFAAAASLPYEQQVTHYANCDGSTTVPVLTVDDFTCFINEFAAGCP